MDYFWIDFIVSMIITGASYIVPIVILRHAILKKPLEKPVAVIITVFIVFGIWLLWKVATQFTDMSFGPAVFWGIVSYNILSSGEDKSIKKEEPAVVTAKINMEDTTEVLVTNSDIAEPKQDSEIKNESIQMDFEPPEKDIIIESTAQEKNENILFGKIKKIPFRKFGIKKVLLILLVLALFISSNTAMYYTAYNLGSTTTINEYSQILEDNSEKLLSNVEYIAYDYGRFTEMRGGTVLFSREYFAISHTGPDYEGQIEQELTNFLVQSKLEMLENQDAK